MQGAPAIFRIRAASHAASRPLALPGRPGSPGSLRYEGTPQSLLGTRSSATVAERLQVRLRRLGGLRRQPRTDRGGDHDSRARDRHPCAAPGFTTPGIGPSTRWRRNSGCRGDRGPDAQRGQGARPRARDGRVPVRLLELADRLRERWAPRGVLEVRLVQSVSDIEEQKAVLAAELPSIFRPWQERWSRSPGARPSVRCRAPSHAWIGERQWGGRHASGVDARGRDRVDARRRPVRGGGAARAAAAGKRARPHRAAVRP